MFNNGRSLTEYQNSFSRSINTGNFALKLSLVLSFLGGKLTKATGPMQESVMY